MNTATPTKTSSGFELLSDYQEHETGVQEGQWEDKVWLGLSIHKLIMSYCRATEVAPTI